jgi:hypothetical protein
MRKDTVTALVVLLVVGGLVALAFLLARCAPVPAAIQLGGDCAAALEGCIAAAKAMEIEADASSKEAWGWYESCANRASDCHLEAGPLEAGGAR